MIKLPLILPPVTPVYDPDHCKLWLPTYNGDLKDLSPEGNHGTVEGEEGSVLIDEDCSDISDWQDYDAVNGVSEVDPAGQFRLDANVAAVACKAGRRRDFSTTPRMELEVKLYHDLIGTNFDGDCVHIRLFHYVTTGVRLEIVFASDGLFIYDGLAYNEVGTNLVKHGGSAEWQTWKFVVDFSIPASSTVDVYLEGVLQASDVDCSWIDDSANILFIYQFGYVTDNMLTHVDHIKVRSESTGNANWTSWLGGMAPHYTGINCGNDSSLDVSELTIMALVKIEDLTKTQVIVGSQTVSLQGWNLAFKGNLNNQLRFNTFDGAASTVDSSNNVITNSSKIYLVTATFDSSKNVKFYVDGVYYGGGAVSYDLSLPAALTVGAWNVDYDTLEGNIPFIALYDRVFSPDEINHWCNRWSLLL